MKHYYQKKTMLITKSIAYTMHHKFGYSKGDFVYSSTNIDSNNEPIGEGANWQLYMTYSMNSMGCIYGILNLIKEMFMLFISPLI